MTRRELWQEPHWSPIPQRWRSRTVEAPFSIALMTSLSDLPRQMQMITFVRCPVFVFETESQYSDDARSIPFRQWGSVTDSCEDRHTTLLKWNLDCTGISL
jgi:hypothetical protein